MSVTFAGCPTLEPSFGQVALERGRTAPLKPKEGLNGPPRQLDGSLVLSLSETCKRVIRSLKTIGIAFLLIVLVSALSAAQEDVSPEVLTQRLIALAGPHGVSCGHAKIGQNLTAQNSCVRRQFRGDQPFYVSYRLQGIDSKSGVGLVRAEDGRMYQMFFDSMGFEPTTKKGETLTESGHLIIEPCPRPYRDACKRRHAVAHHKRRPGR